jgi:hypothetical protein
LLAHAQLEGAQLSRTQLEAAHAAELQGVAQRLSGSSLDAALAMEVERAAREQERGAAAAQLSQALQAREAACDALAKAVGRQVRPLQLTKSTRPTDKNAPPH